MKGSAPGSASEAGLLWRSSGYSPHFPTKTQGREQIFKQDGISSDRVYQKDKGTGSASGKRPEYDAGNLDLPLQTLRSSSPYGRIRPGAVIEEAVTSLVREELKTESDAGKAALCLPLCLKWDWIRRWSLFMKRSAGSFWRIPGFAVAEALSRLRMLKELQGLYRVNLPFERLIAGCYEKLVILLPSMARIKDEDLESAMKAIKLLYQTGGQTGCSREAYFEALERMREDGKLHPGLEGCIHGILFGCGRKRRMKRRLRAGDTLPEPESSFLKRLFFLRGLFFTARDLILWGRGMIPMLDAFSPRWRMGNFLELLPQLRLAFGAFYSGRVKEGWKSGGRASPGKKSGKETPPVLPGVFAYGKELENFVKLSMEGEPDER